MSEPVKPSETTASSWSQQPSPGSAPQHVAAPTAAPSGAPPDLNAAAAVQAKSVLRKGNPLRQGMPWPLIFVQGLLAAGIGIYALVDKTNALKNVMFLIGLFLLINGVLSLITTLRTQGADPKIMQLQMIRAGFGVIPGLIVVINAFGDYMTGNTSRWFVAIGLIGVGAVSLVGLVMAKDSTPIRPAAFIMPAILIIWGGFMIINAARDKNSIQTLGIIMTVLGAALILLGFMRYKQAAGEKAKAKAAKQAAAAK